MVKLATHKNVRIDNFISTRMLLKIKTDNLLTTEFYLPQHEGKQVVEIPGEKILGSQWNSEMI